MRAVLQRVSAAEVRVSGVTVGEIGSGLVVLLGVAGSDTEADATAIATKVRSLRIFGDHEGHMNLGIDDVGGSVLLVSQFTLLAGVRKGRRPSFADAAEPEEATRLIDMVATQLRHSGLEVATGEFGAHMEVALVNDGPVTIIIETSDGAIR